GDDDHVAPERAAQMLMHGASPSIAFGAFRSHLLDGCRHTMVAPRTTLVVDDIRNIRIAEYGAKRRHRAGIEDAANARALQSVQNDVNMLCRVGIVDRRVALEWRERSGQAFAGGLVASGAGRGEQGLALGRIVTSRTGGSRHGCRRSATGTGPADRWRAGVRERRLF